MDINEESNIARVGKHRINLAYASEVETGFLLDIMQEENCSRVLEIGSKYGRMLIRWSQVLPKGARICSIDQPGAPFGDKNSGPILRAVIEHLRLGGFDAHLWIGGSHKGDSIEWARDLGPFDLIFIDADHASEAVVGDWENYSSMARMVAFHDISQNICGGDVAKPYERFCQGRRHESRIEGDRTPGIGVIWV